MFAGIEALFETRDEGKVTVAGFLDFCKAFDSVHHATLMHKVHLLNIHGALKKWLTDYLGHRSHKKIANNSRSLNLQYILAYHRVPYWDHRFSLYK